MYFDYIKREETVMKSLLSGYPNPFNASMHILVKVEKKGEVEVSIYNSLGRKVETLLHGTHVAGELIPNWQTDHLPSGLYYCEFQIKDQVHLRRAAVSHKLKLMLLK
jgi:serine protease AprX